MEVSLHLEEAVLDAFVFKNHNRFRNDKSFRDLKLVQKCLRRLKELNIGKIIGELRDDFPMAVDIRTREGGSLYLPTRQMAKFACVRLHGQFLLLEKLLQYCRLVGSKQLSRLRVGHFWPNALNNLAVISRIWTLSKTFLPVCSSAYASLFPSLRLLPSVGGQRKEEASLVPTLPWPVSADQPHLKEETAATPRSPSSSTAVERRAVDSAQTPIATTGVERADIGVDRTSTDTQVAEAGRDSLPCKPRLWRKMEETVSSWTGARDIVQFTQGETRARKAERKACLTRKLSQGDWRELRCWLVSRCRPPAPPMDRTVLDRVRETALAWMAFPHLKGERPKKWRKIRAHMKKLAMKNNHLGTQ